MFRTYVFDVENRLTGANNNAVSFTYDPDGHLSTYTVSGTTTSFLHDGSNLIAEYNSSGVVTKQYYFGPGTDQPLAWFDGTNYGLFWTDYHGSVIATTTDGGTLVDSNLYKYTPYGEPKTSTNGDGWTGANTRFRYTGQIALPELKLYYYKARVYDPAYGHFLQTDPIGSGDDFDLYAYVKGDPINASDPTGMMYFTHDGFCESGCDGFDPNDDGKAKSKKSSVAPPAPTKIAQILPPAILFGGVQEWIRPLTPLEEQYLQQYLDTGKLLGPERGLPPEGIKPPIEGELKEGPASRPSEVSKGGKSLYDEKGGEWRWDPGTNDWHNPHWDYKPAGSPKIPWQNIPWGNLASHVSA